MTMPPPPAGFGVRADRVPTASRMRTSLALAPSMVFVLSCADTNLPAPPDGGTNEQGADAEASLDGGGQDSGSLVCDPEFAESNPCGGDLMGSWHYVDACGAPKAIVDFIRTCPKAHLVRNIHTITGTAGFSADHAYGWRLSDTFDVGLEVPQACVDSLGGCDVFASIVSLGLGQRVVCPARDDLCDCTAMGTSEDHQQGRYLTMTGTMTATRSDGVRHDYYYCVRGDHALYRRVDEGVVFLIAK